MKLENLTLEQEALMVTIREKWINQLYDLKDINIQQLTTGVHWLYKFCEMEAPRVIVCESIIEAQLTVHDVKANVGANVWANVRANVGANVRANVRANVWANVRDNVGANVGANVWANFETETMCSYGDINDYSWVSFYDFFTQIGVINNKDFNSFMDLLRSNYYSMIQMRGICIVIKNPKHILLNEQKQLNSTKDYAIKFLDNTGMYFVNGLYMSDKLFHALAAKKYSSEDFFKEENEEIKAACISFIQQEFGEEYLFNFLRENLNKIDTYVDKKEDKFLIGTSGGMNVGVYTLFKGKINDTDIAYIRCYCPSTDRLFFLGVNPENTNAKDGIASLYTVPVKLKPHIKSINRQGERFSTVFTEKGNSILNTLSKEDVNNNTTISGTEYFKLMQYEF